MLNKLLFLVFFVPVIVSAQLIMRNPPINFSENYFSGQKLKNSEHVCKVAYGLAVLNLDNDPSGKEVEPNFILCLDNMNERIVAIYRKGSRDVSMHYFPDNNNDPKFGSVGELAYDGSGNFWAADGNNNRIFHLVFDKNARRLSLKQTFTNVESPLGLAFSKINGKRYLFA